MRTMLMSAAAGALLLIGAGAAEANWKDDMAQCLADGGTFTRENGTVTCTIEECVGNSGVGGCGQTVTVEESSKGHLGNKPQHQEECSGPGNSTAQCP